MKFGFLATTLAMLLMASPALAGPALDSDGDGTFDIQDICSADPNVPSTIGCDDDNDGFGNGCDSDFNNDGVVNTGDIPFFAAGFGGPGQTDLNCDGVTNTGDIPAFAASFGGVPGPSGLPCAGTVPCP